jgi:dienelactone hydrolase
MPTTVTRSQEGFAKSRWCVIVAAVLGASALAGCGHTQTAGRHAEPPHTFDYDASRPLQRVDHGVVARRGSIAVHDVAYVSRGQRVAAYVVEPAGRRRRPGIVLVHGSGGDREQLLGAAIELARRGFVAMTITQPSTAHPPPAPSDARMLLADTKLVTLRDVIAVRRAADVLESLPIVKPGRLAYLGWSAGARTGAFVAATDRRFKALVLLSGGSATVRAFVAAAPTELRSLARRQLGSVDPLRYIGLASPGTLLLENGTRDAVVPHPALLNMARAAPQGTLVRWYPAGHELNDKAYRAAFTWVAKKLGSEP